MRNVVRHRRRSLLTALAIVASYALLLVFTGIADGAHEQMAEIGVRMGLGDVVVRAQGASADPGLEHRIDDPEKIVAAAHALGPEVLAVAPRLRVEGLLQAGGTGVAVRVSGVRPEVEAKMSKIEDPAAFVEGHSLAASRRSADGLAPLVLGKALAENLGVRVGDRVTLTVKSIADGLTHTGAFRLSGVFKTGVSEVDAFWVEVPLAEAQRLTGAAGAVTSVDLLLDSSNHAQEMSRALEGTLREEKLEVLPWQRAAPDLYATIALDEGGMYLMMVIVFLVVAAGILNTVLMSVMERTHEFGILLGIGAPPERIVRIVLTEALGLGLLSLALGLAIGLGANHYFATVGLDVRAALGGQLETNGILLPARFFADLSSVKVVWSTVVVLALVVAGAVYPAIRASRLEPVEAMRHA
jgi:ABC-type lipoprotein release transport system permease subunit